MGVRLRKAAMCLLVGGIFVTACAPSDSGEGEIIEDTTAVDAAVPAGPTDAEIAHIVVTANTIDIDAGRLAKEKGSSEEVIAFGDRMITDHTAVNEQASALAGRLNLTPADNATSQSLKASADQAMSELHAASGATTRPRAKSSRPRAAGMYTVSSRLNPTISPLGSMMPITR